jgi:hypothetical protein
VGVTREELLEALRPFGEYAIQMERQWSRTSPKSCFYGVKRKDSKQVRYGDFHRAAALIRREDKC